MAETERQALLDLADRCEREEPTWELCGDIEVAVTPDVTWWRGPGPFLVRSEKRGPYNPPAFVFSLDAAVTLRPEGWIWDVTSTGTAWCMDDRNEQTYGKGATPALALCAAALRARTSLEVDHG